MKKNIILTLLLLVFAVSANSEEIRFAKIGEITGADKGDIIYGDIDMDGDIDLVVTGSGKDGRVSEIFINNGKGLFTSAENQPLEPLRYGDVVIADLNNDEIPDIIIQGQNADNLGSTLIYLNDGSGGFKKKRNTSLIGMYDSTIAVGDINDDGNLDFISAGKINGVKYETAVYLGDGSGLFTQVNKDIIYPMHRGDLKLSDLDNDGDLDLIIIGGTTGGRLGSIYENDGDGFFVETAYDEIEPTIDGTLDVGDVDNDGYADIILCGGKDGGSRFTRLYMNNGDFTFSENESEFINVFSGDVHFSDANGDGYLDLFVSGNSLQGTVIRFYLNDGDGFFDEMKIKNLIMLNHSEIETADLNNNGKEELIVTGLDYSYKRKTIIYRNNN